MNLDDLGREIAVLMATARCGCSVYLPGKHVTTEEERVQGLNLAHEFYMTHPELRFS